MDLVESSARKHVYKVETEVKEDCYIRVPVLHKELGIYLGTNFHIHEKLLSKLSLSCVLRV
jgi:hypothetical protein